MLVHSHTLATYEPKWNGLLKGGTGRYEQEGSAGRFAIFLLLPAASERAVQLHDRESFVFLGDSQIELGGVVVGVVSKHFKVAGRAAVVAKSCQPCGILSRSS